MQWRLSSVACIALWLTCGLAASEEFHESLTFRPLLDGKLAAQFTFTTSLSGAYPRNPNNSTDEDQCMLNFGAEREPCAEVESDSTTLHRLSPCTRSSSSGICRDRIASHSECWEMGL